MSKLKYKRYSYYKKILIVFSYSVFIFIALSCSFSSDKAISTYNLKDVETVSEDMLVAVIPNKVVDKKGWAKDIINILDDLNIPANIDTIAAIMAIIEQESGFSENPKVANFHAIIEKKLRSHAEKFSPLGPQILDKLLKSNIPNSNTTFDKAIKSIKTEKDVDILFQNITTYYELKYPKTLKMINIAGDIFFDRSIEDLNPITTVGSMQVSVKFARDFAMMNKESWQDVRMSLYTRYGGLYYGIARLIKYKAGYDKPLYRFADYNSGFYSCRNASLQGALTRLTNIPLKTDGDFLIYNKQEEVIKEDSDSIRAIFKLNKQYFLELNEEEIRKDLLKEKKLSFEETKTYKKIVSTYEKTTNQKYVYARLPEVVIASAKIQNEKSTAWFARSVDKHYQRFLYQMNLWKKAHKSQ